MSSRWPVVPLGEVLNYRKEFIVINDLDTYKRCRVQLHAQGIVLRDQVPGEAEPDGWNRFHTLRGVFPPPSPDPVSPWQLFAKMSLACCPLPREVAR